MAPFDGGPVMITGAGGGLGIALAEEFHRYGAKLVLTDVHPDALAAAVARLRGQGAEVVSFVHDVTDPEAWARIAERLDGDGRLPTVLVNNAGIAAIGPALELSMRTWQAVIDVDLWGVVHGCREFVPRMQRSGRSCAVLNVAAAAAYVGLGLAAPYNVAKAGVWRLTQALAAEIDPRQVRFTLLCPGPVETGIAADAARRGGADPGTAARAVARLCPIGREPEQVARVAVAGLVRRRAVVNVYWEAWILDFASRILPHQWVPAANRAYLRRGFPELARRLHRRVGRPT